MATTAWHLEGGWSCPGAQDEVAITTRDFPVGYNMDADGSAMALGQVRSRARACKPAMQELVERDRVSLRRMATGGGDPAVEGCTSHEGREEWGRARNGSVYGFEWG
jgi:hypothetical protein